MYIQEIGRMAAEPNGAPATAPSFFGTHRFDPHREPDA